MHNPSRWSRRPSCRHRAALGDPLREAQVIGLVDHRRRRDRAGGRRWRWVRCRSARWQSPDRDLAAPSASGQSSAPVPTTDPTSTSGPTPSRPRRRRARLGRAGPGCERRAAQYGHDRGRRRHWVRIRFRRVGPDHGLTIMWSRPPKAALHRSCLPMAVGRTPPSWAAVRRTILRSSK